MKKKVLLSILGKQSYSGQEPDTIELTTAGWMELRDGGWDICYEETELTGLAGVTTTFRVEPGKVILNREGKLKSRMEFRQGVTHESLYQMEFGALMMSICPMQVFFDITPEGGFIDLVYTVEIEHSETGEIDYHLDIRVIE